MKVNSLKQYSKMLFPEQRINVQKTGAFAEHDLSVAVFSEFLFNACPDHFIIFQVKGSAEIICIEAAYGVRGCEYAAENGLVNAMALQGVGQVCCVASEYKTVSAVLAPLPTDGDDGTAYFRKLFCMIENMG